MSVPDDGPIPAMEGVLSSVIDPYSIAGAASHLLARDAFQPDPDRTREETGDLLGRHRQLHVLLSGGSAVGDEQPLVGNQQRRRELAAQAWWAMGRSAVGLDRGADQVRSPDGCVLFRNGLGRGAASGTQWVLNGPTHPSTQAFNISTPLPPSLPPLLSAPSPTFLTPVPAAWCSFYPVYRVLPGLASHGARDKQPPNAWRPPVPDRDINSQLPLLSFTWEGRLEVFMCVCGNIDVVFNCNFVNIFIHVRYRTTAPLDTCLPVVLHSLIYNLFLVRVPCQMSVIIITT